MNIRLRDRGIIALIGAGIYWASGYVAGILLLTVDRPSVTCTNTGTRTCATAFVLVIIAGIGFWIALIAGATLLVGIIEREAKNRAKKKGEPDK